MKTCPICQKKFQDKSRRKNKVYCSHEHYLKAHKLRVQERKTQARLDLHKQVVELKDQTFSNTELLKSIQARIEAQYQWLLKMNKKAGLIPPEQT